MTTRSPPMPWTDPMRVLAGLPPGADVVALLSGDDGGPSWISADLDVHIEDRIGPNAGGEAVQDAAASLVHGFGAPPLDRRTLALLSYDAGARPAIGPRPPDALAWPDRVLVRCRSVLRFDPAARTVQALADDAAGLARALAWLDAARDPPAPPPPAAAFPEEAPPRAYLDAVADVIDRIGRGELFQANIARAWSGPLRPGAEPIDALFRLAGRGAAYGAYVRIGDLALVSNSPELFVALPPDGRIEARPIKGTRPRRPDPVDDAREAAALLASAKDRAENLMIVDLMRNDLARVARVGSVRAPALFALDSLPTVHHLVSTITADLAPGLGPADLIAAAFPPGSVTGAPKHQALKVIADHEPPRGPWCGTLAWLDDAGGLTASVLIRTVGFRRSTGGGWSFRTQAGAGITAGSEPTGELAETEAKIAALRHALAGA